MNFCQDDMAVEFKCRACGRQEDECSAEPCDAVRNDRIAFYVAPAPRVRLSTLALVAIAATALAVAGSFIAGQRYAACPAIEESE